MFRKRGGQNYLRKPEWEINFESSLSNVFLEIAASKQLAKPWQNAREGVYFLVKLQTVGYPSQVFFKKINKTIFLN